MNILPKKRWHVRNRDNIARVRRDEAKAAEEAKAIEERIKLAETEARRELLLKKSRERIKTDDFISVDTKSESGKGNCEASNSHINFFQELEDRTAEQKQVNKEHEKEKKEEREKYEKQIGYLTYLGQDTNEALGIKSWYDVLPDRASKDSGEINMKTKIREDPLEIMKKYTSEAKKTNDIRKANEKIILYKSIVNDTKSSSSYRKRKRSSDSDSDHTTKVKKSKYHREYDKKLKNKKYSSSSSSESSDSENEQERTEKQRKIELLRAERLKREKEERQKAQDLLSKLKGETKTEAPKQSFRPKYSSQFNPELARQNYNRK